MVIRTIRLPIEGGVDSVIAALNLALAGVYWARIVAVAYFRTPLATPKAQGGTVTMIVAGVCVLVIVLAGLMPEPLLTWLR